MKTYVSLINIVLFFYFLTDCFAQIAFTPVESQLQVSTVERGGNQIRSADRIIEVPNIPNQRSALTQVNTVPVNAFSAETTFNMNPRRRRSIQGYQDYLSRQYRDNLQGSTIRNNDRVTALRNSYFRFYANQAQTRLNPVVVEQQREILRQSPTNTSPRSPVNRRLARKIDEQDDLNSSVVIVSQSLESSPTYPSSPFLSNEFLKQLVGGNPNAARGRRERLASQAYTAETDSTMTPSNFNTASAVSVAQTSENATTASDSRSHDQITPIRLGARILDPPEIEDAIENLNLISEGETAGITTFVMPSGVFVDAVHASRDRNGATDGSLSAENNDTTSLNNDSEDDTEDNSHEFSTRGIAIIIGRASNPTDNSLDSNKLSPLPSTRDTSSTKYPSSSADTTHHANVTEIDLKPASADETRNKDETLQILHPLISGKYHPNPFATVQNTINENRENKNSNPFVTVQHAIMRNPTSSSSGSKNAILGLEVMRPEPIDAHEKYVLGTVVEAGPLSSERKSMITSPTTSSPHMRSGRRLQGPTVKDNGDFVLLSGEDQKKVQAKFEKAKNTIKESMPDGNAIEKFFSDFFGKMKSSLQNIKDHFDKMELKKDMSNKIDNLKKDTDLASKKAKQAIEDALSDTESKLKEKKEDVKEAIDKKKDTLVSEGKEFNKAIVINQSSLSPNDKIVKSNTNFDPKNSLSMPVPFFEGRESVMVLKKNEDGTFTKTTTTKVTSGNNITVSTVTVALDADGEEIKNDKEKD